MAAAAAAWRDSTNVRACVQTRNGEKRSAADDDALRQLAASSGKPLQECRARRIVARRAARSPDTGNEYLVEWDNRPLSWRTWEPEAHLYSASARAALARFNATAEQVFVAPDADAFCLKQR